VRVNKVYYLVDETKMLLYRVLNGGEVRRNEEHPNVFEGVMVT